MSIQPTTPTTPTGRARTLVTGLLLAALALGAVSGCKADKSGASGANQGLSDVDSTTGTSATPDPGSSGGTDGASASATATAKPSSKPSTKSGAQIVVFKATQLPLCPIPGTVDAPFHQDARDVILAWQVIGATGVDLYMDGGLYGSYGPTGTQQLFFGCDTKPEQTHEYKLVTTGSGSPVTKSFKISVPNDPAT